ncbi:MAG: cytochrome oxidase maturation protein, cbb3-type [Gammaproteobacteria bacterium MedPE]|nr:MAG: cytochrome oxidase maturation protein, cbb3-type [Gammaproteobacteria bacterium MedPE]
MNIILLLIPVAIGVIIVAGFIFVWAVKTDQFEDLDRQGSNILFDDDEVKSTQDKPPQ